MKRICLVLILQFTICSLHAQKNDSASQTLQDGVANGKNERLYDGFTIRFNQTNLHTSGFDILLNGKDIAHHFPNPLPFTPTAMQKKDNAFKAAQWIIDEYQKTGHWENMVPPHVARQLGIQF